MIQSKEQALYAAEMIEECINSMNVQGGSACVRVGNAYLACIDLKNYISNLEDPKPEDEPPEDEPKKGD